MAHRAMVLSTDRPRWNQSAEEIWCTRNRIPCSTAGTFPTELTTYDFYNTEILEWHPFFSAAMARVFFSLQKSCDSIQRFVGGWT
jgi:hypothetical protein